MRKAIEITSVDAEEQDDDIIVLGVASIETMGGGAMDGEPLGFNPIGVGISDE